MRALKAKSSFYNGSRTRMSAADGFTLVELVMSMALTLVILGIAVATFSGALGSRERESSRTDALTSAQAALNIMSREIGNAGYGIVGGSGLPISGMVTADSDANQLHFRANVDNTGANGATTAQPGEDVTYYCESCNGTTSGSVVRSDANVNSGAPSGIINRVSDVDFAYFDVDPTTCVVSTVQNANPPTANTVKVRITLIVILPEVRGQPSNQKQRLTSEVTLRNSLCMLQQY